MLNNNEEVLENDVKNYGLIDPENKVKDRMVFATPDVEQLNKAIKKA